MKSRPSNETTSPSTSSTASAGIPTMKATPSNGTTSPSTSSTASAGIPTITPTANLTTSAVIFIGDSTTTSKTTMTIANGTSTSTTSDLLFVASFSDGDVSSFSRSSEPYITTVNGEVLTIPAISASTTRSSSRISSSDASSTDHQTATETSNGQQSTVTSAATVGVTGGGRQGQGSPTYSSPTTSTTGSSSGGGDGGSNAPPAGTIAGGVVGGAAGLAVLLLIAMLFVRWYRRKNQMQALPPNSGTARGLDGSSAPSGSGPSGPGMAERSGLSPLAAAIPGIFRHQNRSGETAPSERGFTRVSGRKLPSVFSEGMSSEGVRKAQTGGPQQTTPGMPLSSSPPEQDLSSTSFYRDSAGFYGGDGESSSNGPSGTSPEEMMMMSPGPQRQPQVHAGGPYVMSPASAEQPGLPNTGTLGRSDTPSSLRNSRFTEDM
ncbi:Hypothetical predicted protein [Lecanosticta acicola]|uniref:Uncharacterized protein n=1 Tax=Lecanosticta acicola TaxID=111012 RepID=A0AAI8Z055_9PEZI|nr:Hypothetical predicted protein [Lecanosticta acicola]